MDDGELLVGAGQTRVEDALPSNILGEVPGLYDYRTVEFKPARLVWVKNDDRRTVPRPAVLISAANPTALSELDRRRPRLGGDDRHHPRVAVGELDCRVDGRRGKSAGGHPPNGGLRSVSKRLLPRSPRGSSWFANPEDLPRRPVAHLEHADVAVPCVVGHLKIHYEFLPSRRSPVGSPLIHVSEQRE